MSEAKWIIPWLLPEVAKCHLDYVINEDKIGRRRWKHSLLKVHKIWDDRYKLICKKVTTKTSNLEVAERFSKIYNFLETRKKRQRRFDQTIHRQNLLISL